MTTTLQGLIRQARTELGSDACRAGRHNWVSEGGRACPHELTGNCSQAVYHCSVCGEQDYGEPGGPGHNDCDSHCQHRFERDIQIRRWRVDPLGYGWPGLAMGQRVYHRTLLRALRRQPKPKLP